MSTITAISISHMAVYCRKIEPIGTEIALSNLRRKEITEEQAIKTLCGFTRRATW